MTSFRRTLILAALTSLVPLTLAACGDDGGTTTDSGAADTGAGDSAVADSGTDDASTDGGTDGGTDAATDAATDAGGGTACITHLDPACGATEYCDFPDDLCGMGEAGVCQTRPTDCEDISQPSCGCNALVYSNGCEVMSGGFDLNNNATCTPAAMTFACGSRICQEGMELCSVTPSDVSGSADSYSCEPLPAACMTAGSDCSCFAGSGTSCADMCAVDSGNFTLTCPGG